MCPPFEKNNEAKNHFGLASIASLFALLGPALGYKGFYLSHLCIPPLVIGIIAHAILGQRTGLSISAASIIILVILDAGLETALITRSPNGWAHLVMITLSLGTLVLGLVLTRNYLSIGEVQRLFLVFCTLLITLCLCELVFNVRLPDSRYSDFLVANSGNGPDIPYYNVPTGFYGNQNNLALMIVLLLPFAELVQRRSLRNFLLIVLVTIVVATDSRIAVFSLLLIAGMRGLARLRSRPSVIALVLLSAVGVVLFIHLGLPLHLCDGDSGKMCVVYNIAKNGEGLDQIAAGSDSLGVRLQLTLQAWHLLVENPFFGIGPGTSSEYLSATHFSAGEINVLHNPVLEILVEYGIVGSSLWIAGWLMLLRSTSQVRVARIRNAFTCTILVIPITSIGVSTLYYFTPFWAALGMIAGISSQLSQPKLTTTASQNAEY